MTRRVGYGLWWLALMVYGFLIAPGPDPDLLGLISELGSFTSEDRLSTGLFNLMGVWPFLFLALLSGESGTRIPPWLFAAASFALGAFVLLPYFVIRAAPVPSAAPSRWRSIMGSRVVGALATVIVLGLVTWAVLGADLAAFEARWVSSNFVNVMSIDFVCLSVLFPLAAQADASRRSVSPALRVVMWVPLLGAALYVALRPAP